MDSALISEIRNELHNRVDSIIDRLLATARAEALNEISGKLGEIAELPAFKNLEAGLQGPPGGDDVPFAMDALAPPGSRATDPSIVLFITKLRDEQGYEWNEIVDRLKKARAKTVTGVPWSRDNVIKLYQTAKSKTRKQSDGRKLQGKYMGLLRSVPKDVGQRAKDVRKSTGLTQAVRFLESERKKTHGGRKATKASKGKQTRKAA